MSVVIHLADASWGVDVEKLEAELKQIPRKDDFYYSTSPSSTISRGASISSLKSRISITWAT